VSCVNCKTVYNIKFHPPAVAGICDKCEGQLIQRSDDKEETARNRLQVYMDQTQPLLKYYEQQGTLVTFDGNRNPQIVFEEVRRELEKLK